MFNDNLKKFNNVIAVLMSAIFAAGVVIGCGAKAEDPGGSVAIAAEKSTEVVETEEPAVVAEESVDIFDREKPKELGYYEEVKEGDRTENRFVETAVDPTNKFIMVEEVEDPGKEHYVKVTGTLYEVFFYGEPDNDLVYFPGDELPEGYEVKVTEDYEIALDDYEGAGEGHSTIFGTAYLAEKDSEGKIAYKYRPGCCIWDNDLDPSIPDDKSYAVGPAIKPGMYGMYSITTYDFDDGWSEMCPDTFFIQALLKDQMPTDGTEVSDNVMHQ